MLRGHRTGTRHAAARIHPLNLYESPSSWLAANDLAFAIRDRFPVSPGHTLVITRRVVADWFAATPDERLAVMALVDEVKAALDRELTPAGYNVGFNAGAVAGQTVMHLHVHVIPRFVGDMDDPRVPTRAERGGLGVNVPGCARGTAARP
jgi:diadenosine tetraphosphate (Ap4A) HIT family hydrolase